MPEMAPGCEDSTFSLRPVYAKKSRSLCANRQVGSMPIVCVDVQWSLRARYRTEGRKHHRRAAL